VSSIPRLDGPEGYRPPGRTLTVGWDLVMRPNPDPYLAFGSANGSIGPELDRSDDAQAAPSAIMRYHSTMWIRQ